MATVRTLSNEEVRSLLECRTIKGRDREMKQLLLVMQLGCGPRISELLSLNCEDLYLPCDKTVEEIFFRHTKNGTSRKVPLPPEVLPYAAAWRRVLDRRGLLLRMQPLFCKRNGNRISRFYVYDLYARAQRELGLSRIGTHSLRKTWARATYDFWHDEYLRGIPVDPLAKTAKIGGWKDLSCCARYIGLERFDARNSQFSVLKNIIG